MGGRAWIIDATVPSTKDRNIEGIEKQRQWGGRSAFTPVSSIEAINTPSGIRRSGTFYSLSIRSAADLLWTATLSHKWHAACQILRAPAEYHAWAQGGRRMKTPHKGPAWWHRHNLQVNNASSKNQADKDGCNAHTHTSGENKKDIVWLSLGSSLYWFPWERRAEQVNRW